MLKELQRPGVYTELERKSARFAEMLNGISRATGVPTQLNRVGSVMTVFFAPDPVKDFESAMRSDVGRYAQHYRQMLANGIYLAPSQFEAAFVSMAHSEKDLDTAAKMTEWSFKKLLEK